MKQDLVQWLEYMFHHLFSILSMKFWVVIAQ